MSNEQNRAVAVKSTVEIDWLELGRCFSGESSADQAAFFIGASIGLTGAARDMQAEYIAEALAEKPLMRPEVRTYLAGILERISQ